MTMHRSGQPVHASVVCRWIISSVRGAHLESIKIGGSTYASIEALQRFADRLTTAEDQQREWPPKQRVARQRQIERASARLADALRPARRGRSG